MVVVGERDGVGAKTMVGDSVWEASPRRDCSWKLSRGCAVINSGAWFIQLDFWNVLTAIWHFSR